MGNGASNEEGSIVTSEQEKKRREDAAARDDGTGAAVAAGVTAAAAVVGAAALIYNLTKDKSEKRVQAQPGLAGQQKRIKQNGRNVVAEYVGCGSQAQAFRAARSKDRNNSMPLLHRPHGRGPEDRWHYHPARHGVWENNRLIDYHYMFPGTDERRIFSADEQLRNH